MSDIIKDLNDMSVEFEKRGMDWASRKAFEGAKEIERLTNLINTPHTDDFLEAVKIEVAHQRERWSDEHDASKDDDWWLWTVAFLTTKANEAKRYDDHEKHLHHIITTAALCAQWHRHAQSSVLVPEQEPSK